MPASYTRHGRPQSPMMYDQMAAWEEPGMRYVCIHR